MIGVFLFVLALLAVVLIHEAGHFTAAKAYGIKVEEYFVGFGPLIWSTKRGLFGSGRWRKRNARSETDYGVNFCSMVARDNVVATQFHPEKSGKIGLRIYDNFLRNALGGHPSD